MASAAPATPATQADLVITSISSPASIAGAGAAGTQLSYAVTVKNEGAVSAGGVKFVTALPQGLPAGTTVTVTGLPGFNCTSQGAAPALITVTCEGGTIAGNASVTLNFTVALTGRLTTGVSLTAEAIVDPHNLVAESNDNNNQRATSTVVY